MFFLLFLFLFCRRKVGVGLNFRYSSENSPPVAKSYPRSSLPSSGPFSCLQAPLKVLLHSHSHPRISAPTAPSDAIRHLRLPCLTSKPPLPHTHFGPSAVGFAQFLVASLPPWFAHAEDIDIRPGFRPVLLPEMSQVLPGLP